MTPEPPTAQPQGTQPAPLSPTPRSTVRRGAARAVGQRQALYDLLDQALVCHLAVVVDGAPWLLPTTFGRDGDTVFVHGSTGARTLREAAAGAPVCLTVTLLDGVVYGRSVFHHSMNYRSAVVHGTATPLRRDADKLHAARVITEHVAPGSWGHARHPDRRELAATALLALPLAEASVKIRTGPPVDEEADVADGGRWAGVLPLSGQWGAPVPCPLLPPGLPVPPHVAGRAAGARGVG